MTKSMSVIDPFLYPSTRLKFSLCDDGNEASALQYAPDYYTVFRKKTPIHVFFYISVENVSICTKFSGYVCDELGIPLKSKLNIHCIEIFIIYCGSVKRIIHKPVNMTS